MGGRQQGVAMALGDGNQVARVPHLVEIESRTVKSSVRLGQGS